MSLNSGGHAADRVANWLSRRSKGTSVADVPDLGAVVGTTIGEVRKENQDRVVIARYVSADTKDRWIALLLCDGMGGMVDGARCAELATSVFIGSMIRPTPANLRTRARNAILSANAFLNKRYAERGGTTIAGLAYSDELVAFNAGDSRIYSLSRTGLTQLSTDDSIAGELQRLKIPTQSDADIPSYITQFVGIGGPLEPHVETIELTTGSDSLWILTSDGLHNPTEHVLADVLRHSQNLSTSANRLLQLSRWCGGADNASIIAVREDAFRGNAFAGSAPGLLEVWDSTSKIEIVIESVGSSRVVVPDIVDPQELRDDTTTTNDKKGRSRRTKQKRAKTDAAQTNLDIVRELEPVEVAILDHEPIPTSSGELPQTESSKAEHSEGVENKEGKNLP